MEHDNARTHATDRVKPCLALPRRSTNTKPKGKKNVSFLLSARNPPRWMQRHDPNQSSCATIASKDLDSRCCNSRTSLRCNASKPERKQSNEDVERVDRFLVKPERKASVSFDELHLTTIVTCD
eukprot:scaffold43992_cov252-Amphora_coffeaeformis.AAC.1